MFTIPHNAVLVLVCCVFTVLGWRRQLDLKAALYGCCVWHLLHIVRGGYGMTARYAAFGISSMPHLPYSPYAMSNPMPTSAACASNIYRQDSCWQLRQHDAILMQDLSACEDVSVSLCLRCYIFDSVTISKLLDSAPAPHSRRSSLSLLLTLLCFRTQTQ